MVTPGDIILDAQGAIGIVIDVYENNIRYRTVAHDKMEMIFEASAGMYIPLGERFKKQYLKELRKLERRNDAI